MARVAAAERRLASDVKGEIIRVVNHVRARRERPGIGRIEIKQNIESFSAVYRGYSSNFPTSKNGLRHSRWLAPKCFPLP